MLPLKKVYKLTGVKALYSSMLLESTANVKNVSNLPPISFSGTAGRLCGLCIFATWTEKQHITELKKP